MRKIQVLLLLLVSQFSFSLGIKEENNGSNYFSRIDEIDIDFLYLESLDFDIEIRRNFENRVELEFESSKPSSYRIEKEKRGKELFVRIKSNNIFSVFETRSSRVIVLVPDMINLEIHGISGDALFEKVRVSSKINLTSGDLSLRDTDGNFLIKSTSSNMDIKNFIGRLVIESVSGDITGKM
jgi:hypothetical protein